MKRTSSGSSRSVILEYWRHAWRYKFLTTGVFVTVAIASATLHYLPQLFIAEILEKVSAKNFIPGDLLGSFGTPLIWYITLSFFGGVIMWRVAVIFIWTLEIRVLRDIYQRMFSHLTQQSMGFHSNKFGGSLVSQANKFGNSYVRIADTVFFDLYTLILAFAITFTILAPRAPYVTLALFIGSVIFILLTTRITKVIRTLRARESEKENKQTGFLADAITNILTIKSFAAENYENKRFADVTNEVKKASFNVMKTGVALDTVFAFTTILISIVAVVGALAAVVYYDANIGTVYLIIVFTAQISQRLWEFSQNTLKNINQGIGDAEAMATMLAHTPEIQDSPDAKPIRIAAGTVEFNAVTFTHNEASEPTFENLTLSINAGEKIGLVGASGSGKTTFTKLLLRFSDIQSGKISIDGYDISKIHQHDLHNAISYVPQEPLLFHRSIKENIAYDQLGASQIDIEKAARMAHAHEFIGSLSNGYDTLVGERGVKLSGGQRQRIAIARAMLKNSPILVLDEATSALDSESEVLIQDALWKLMKHKTAVVIAHRLSTVQKMDRIVVLDNGRIVEEGSHKDLLAKKGTYAKLWAHQSGGFLEE